MKVLFYNGWQLSLEPAWKIDAKKYEIRLAIQFFIVTITYFSVVFVNTVHFGLQRDMSIAVYFELPIILKI